MALASTFKVAVLISYCSSEVIERPSRHVMTIIFLGATFSSITWPFQSLSGLPSSELEHGLFKLECVICLFRDLGPVLFLNKIRGTCIVLEKR